MPLRDDSQENTPCAALIYYDRLLEDSASLESLRHSLAFERLLLDNMTERRTLVNTGSLTLMHDAATNEMYEIHGMPSVFEINSFSGRLIEIPIEDGQTQWSFHASYKVNDNAYAMIATQESTVLTTTTDDHGELRYTSDAHFPERFLAAMAISALWQTQGEYATSAARPEVLDNVTSQGMVKSMQLLGNLAGRYDSTIVAYLSMLGLDRAAIVSLTEAETPSSSEITVKHRMAWKVTASRIIGHLSSQYEKVSTDDSAANECRFAGARTSSHTEPDQLPYSAEYSSDEEMLFSNPDTRVFKSDDSAADAREYFGINLSIMALVAPLLKEYEDLDKIEVER